MNKKNILLLCLAAVVLVGLLLGVYFATRPQTSQGAKTITVEVVHKDGTEKTFTYHTDAEFLGQVLQDNKLVEGVQGEYGLNITAVDGEEASWEKDQAYWALYIGQEYAQTGADSTPVHDGDVFRLVYTKG